MHHIKPQTELHINNPSFQWLGQNLSNMKKKKKYSEEKGLEGQKQNHLQDQNSQDSLTAYTETSCDTCLTSFGCMDTCSSAELNAAPKLKGRANTNYLSAQYEQPPLD